MEMKNWKFVLSLIVAGAALFGMGVYQIELAIKPVEILVEKNSQAIENLAETVEKLSEKVDRIADKVNRIEGYLIGRNGYQKEKASRIRQTGATE